MNDVKELCDLMLDGPQPPLRTSDEALAVARRATRRRDRLRIAGSGVAVMAAVTGAAALVVPSAGGPAPAESPYASPRERRANATPPAVPPTWHQADGHGGEVVRILTAAVPAGFSSRLEYGDAASTLQLQRPHGGGAPPFATVTSLILEADGKEGRLESMLHSDGTPAPTGDLCSAAIAARMDKMIGPADGGCQVVVVDGVQIRVATTHDPDRGQVIAATRFLTGGFLTVFAQQGVVVYERDGDVPPDATHSPEPDPDHKPALDAPPLTGQQAAALAANPAMLP